MTEVAQPSGSVTLVFTDIEGSTKLLEKLGSSAYKEALAEHRLIVREECARHSGYEVDEEGDAFFYAFASAKDAVSAVSDAMRGLQDGPISIRVGIHTGEPELDPPKYVGLDVHRAARIMSSAHGGQVVLSPSTVSLLEPGEFELRALGQHRLKDLSAPIALSQLVLEGLPSEFPPLKTLHQTNLPIPQTPFLGRERELEEVLSLLGREDVRLLTLTGPGGTGKTRLAAQAAGALADHYPHGVFWVPLAPLRESALVLETAAQVVGAKDDLASYIADKEVLLLFDNFERVVEGAGGLSELLGSCPKLELLVTSREPLHLSGEHEYPVPPLVHEEGVGFFLARARAVKPDFEANGSVSEICRRLDDLPLALELAASRVKVLSSEQILARLEQRLPLLTGGARDAPERQRTLRAAIEWSYELLSDEEQKLFAWLSVFAGGCTLEAAEEVCDADLDTLQSLVEKSLFRFTGERYWMLETIREFASDCLESDERIPLCDRHARTMAAWAERAQRGLKSEDEAKWLHEFAQEQANVRAAIRHLDAHADAGPLLDLAVSIGNYWEIRGEWREGMRVFQAALERTSGERTRRRMQALGYASMFAGHAQDWDMAREHADEALSISRGLGEQAEMLWLLPHLSHAALELGNDEEAVRLLEEAIEVADRTGDRWAQASCDGHLADLALRRHDSFRALACAESALEHYRELGWTPGIAWCLHLRAAALYRIGELSTARAAAVEGLALAHSIGDAETRIWFLVLAAALMKSARDLDAPARLLGAVDALSNDVGLALTGAEAELRAEVERDLRRRLGSRYDAHHSQGARLDVDEAVSLALNVERRSFGADATHHTTSP